MTEHIYSLDELEANGFEVSKLPAEQQTVLQHLSPEEFALLAEIKARLEEAAPEVMAHSDVAGAALF